MASVLLVRDDCRCAKGGGRKHQVRRIRPYLGRDTAGRQQWGRSRTFHGSKRKADRLAAEMEAEVRSGRSLASADLTIERYLERWYAEEVIKTLAQRTQADYRRQLDRHLIPQMGSIRLRDLTTQHVIEMRNQVLAQKGVRTGRPPIREAEYAVQVIRSALTFAVKTGLITVNVARGVTGPKRHAQPRPPYDRAVIGKVVEIVRATDIGMITEFTARTGVRPCEAPALRWSDIDLRMRQAHIHGSLQRISGRGLVFGPVKTHRSARPVRLDIALVARLREHRRRQTADQERLGDAYHDDDLVFPWPDGRPRDPTNVTRHFRRILDAHGLPHLTPKDFRHAFATLNLAAGEPLAEVCAQLGHANATTTLKFYADHLPSQQAAMVDRFGASLDAVDEHKVDVMLTDADRHDRSQSA